MRIENFLKQFWRCTDWKSFGDDEEVRAAFDIDKKIIGKNIYLSGLRLEYDYDEPGAPAFLAFDVWDLNQRELQPDYFTTGYITEFRPIKNGFVVVSANDENGETTYTFKKTTANPFTRKKLKNTVSAHPMKSIITAEQLPEC